MSRMMRPALHCLFRPPVILRSASASTSTTRRLLSTTPPAKRSRSWKSSGARWGLAAGLLYWYSTSDFSAEDVAFPIANPHTSDDRPVRPEETSLPTIESVRSGVAARRKAQQNASPGVPNAEIIDSPSPTPPPVQTNTSSSTLELGLENPSQDTPSATESTAAPNPPSSPHADSAPETTTSPALEGQEEEAAQQGAFDEETGEINWDCPCLGGMAHGPCGEEFRAAFSCFVHSKEEPKGMECIDQFKTMQDCFRQHPEIYGSELDEDAVDDELTSQEDASSSTEDRNSSGSSKQDYAGSSLSQESNSHQDTRSNSSTSSTGSDPSSSTSSDRSTETSIAEDATARAKAAKAQVQRDHGDGQSETDNLVPKATHDAR